MTVRSSTSATAAAHRRPGAMDRLHSGSRRATRGFRREVALIASARRRAARAPCTVDGPTGCELFPRGTRSIVPASSRAIASAGSTPRARRWRRSRACGSAVVGIPVEDQVLAITLSATENGPDPGSGGSLTPPRTRAVPTGTGQKTGIARRRGSEPDGDRSLIVSLSPVDGEAAHAGRSPGMELARADDVVDEIQALGVGSQSWVQRALERRPEGLGRDRLVEAGRRRSRA